MSTYIPVSYDERQCVACGDSFKPSHCDTRTCGKSRCVEEVNERRCETPGCGRAHRAKGLCGRCYNRKRTADGLRADEVPDWGPAQIDAYHRRRAAKKNPDGVIEKIDIELVSVRDDWNCGICGEPIDPLIAYPDPMSRSLDHIMPLARGGTHTFNNVQIAHWRCNRNKSDSLPTGVGSD